MNIINKEQLLKMKVTELKVILKYQGFKNASQLRKDELATLLSKRPKSLEEIKQVLPKDFKNEYIEYLQGYESKPLESVVYALKQATDSRYYESKKEFHNYEETQWKEKAIQLENFKLYLENIKF